MCDEQPFIKKSPLNSFNQKPSIDVGRWNFVTYQNMLFYDLYNVRIPLANLSDNEISNTIMELIAVGCVPVNKLPQHWFEFSCTHKQFLLIQDRLTLQLWDRKSREWIDCL